MTLHLRQRVHVSWHITWVSVGLLAGTALSVIAPAGLLGDWPWGLAGITLAVVSLRWQQAFICGIALAAGLLLGMWRGGLEQSLRTGYAQFYGQSLTIRGTIVEDTVHTSKGDQRLRLGSPVIQNKQLPGVAWVNTRSRADIKRGDIVTAQGILQPGFGNLPAAMPSATIKKIERPQPGDIARRVRDWFADGVRRAIPEPQASLGIGYLTGQRSTLPESLNDQLRTLGLTHVVVASGYNLTILVRFSRRAFAKISKYLATLSASLMISSFVLITGFSPSMTRAGLVTGLSLIAWYYGRTIHPVVLLFFVAGITVLIDPSAMWGDLGWYLSFLSFAGVILLSPLITHYFWGTKTKPGMVRQLLVDTGSAQLITMPLLVFVFGQYSPLALPANVLVLPLIPLTMALTFLAGMASLIAPQFASWAGLPSYGILTYMTTIINKIASVPWANGTLRINAQVMVICYGVMLAVGLFLWRKTRHTFTQNNVVE